MGLLTILSRIRAEPWAITRETLETIVAIAERENETPQAVAARLGRPLDNTYDVEVRDGIAIIPVAGPLFRYANLFTMVSGATSYEILARDFARALDDPMVDGILLNIDSPGGEVNGVSELADMIYAGRKRKPVKAYVGGLGASGGYWIAAAAEEIIAADTAQLGSIGVVAAFEDSREAEAKSGRRRFEIVSSQSPDKRLDPTTDDGRSKIQARIDALAGIFVGKVATFRGVDEAKVLKDYGRGGVLVGADAVAAGLADRVGSFEGILAEMVGGSMVGPTGFAALGGIHEGGEMAKEEGAQPAGVKPEDVTAAADKARAEGMAAGAAGERARIREILECEDAKERGEFASHLALETEIPAAQALALLAKAPKEAPKAGAGFAQFDRAMREAGNPNVGADHAAGGGGTPDAGDALVAVARSLNLAK